MTGAPHDWPASYHISAQTSSPEPGAITRDGKLDLARMWAQIHWWQRYLRENVWKEKKDA